MKVVSRAAPDIPGGDHLAAGEAGRGRGFDDRHPLVVGRETDAQVHREDRLLDGDERQRLERGEHPQHHRQVQRGMQHEERGLHRRGTVSPPRKPRDPQYVHTAASQQHEGEEERRLPARQPRCHRAAPVSRRVRRGQDGSVADIRVAAHFVGMRVVGVVLGNPPAEAEPDEHVPHDEAEQAIAPARTENLVVSRVMADEGQLGEHHPHHRGHGQGRPRVAGHDEQRPSSEEGGDRQGDLHPVVARPAVEQTDRPYLPRQRMKASRRRIHSSSPPARSRDAAGPQHSKAGCSSHRHSVLLGVCRANRSGLKSPGSGATRPRPGPAATTAPALRYLHHTAPHRRHKARSPYLDGTERRGRRAGRAQRQRVPRVRGWITSTSAASSRSHTSLLASADDAVPSQPVSSRPARCEVSWSQTWSHGPNGGRGRG